VVSFCQKFTLNLINASLKATICLLKGKSNSKAIYSLVRGLQDLDRLNLLGIDRIGLAPILGSDGDDSGELATFLQGSD
jgi:hypothetical protein